MIWGSDNNFNRIVRIDAEGNETHFSIPNLPNESFNVGDITEDGYLYLYRVIENKFYIIDLNESNSTYLQLVDPELSYALDTAPYGRATYPFHINDMAYNPKDKKFYSIINTSGTNAFKILAIDPIDLSYKVASTAVSGGGIQGESSGSGAVFFDQNGFFYTFSNMLGKYYRINLQTNTATLLSTNSIAFTCDSYLYQVIAPNNSSNSTLYKYNPFTGSRMAVKLLERNYNAIGYNQLDNMIYGADVNSSDLVRIDSEGNERIYTVPNLPMGPYNVADITDEGYLYIYSGLGTTYFIIDVNQSRPTYMQLVDPRIAYAIDTAPYGVPVIGYAISDMAYNPVDKMFYSIIVPGRANSFKILKINPVDLSFTLSTSTVTGGGIQGETGGAGAVFFDKDESFYLFNNSQGRYYRVDLATNQATLLSTYTPNGSNDGASCPIAPSFQIDLGDAPDTYKTLLNSEGPSHVLSSNLLLGQYVDAEDDGQPTTNADGDNLSDTPNDEDALAAVPALGTTYTSYELDVKVTNNTGADATLSGWVDFNRNGVFNTGERAQATVPNGATSVKLNWTGLSGLSAGQSYIRLRIASVPSEVANPSGDAGAAGDGEVEDYSVNIFLVPPPTAVPDELTTNCDAGTIDILANDLPGGAPIVTANTRLLNPADSSRVVSVMIPAEGTFLLNPTTGIVTFTPEAAFQGTSSLRYVIVDENNLESIAAINVTVDCPLPVKLLNFDLSMEQNIVQLNWATTSETNSDYFQIERSQNAKDWITIGSVNAQGESAQLKQYRYTDAMPLAGENLYRLKMIDQDMTFAYSRIRSLNIDSEVDRLSIYPNPATDYIRIQAPEQVVSVHLIDKAGKRVLPHSAKIDQLGKLKVSGLEPGVYILNLLRKDGTTTSHKLIIDEK